MTLLDRVRNILHIDRAISMPNIYQLVYSALDQQTQVDNMYRPLIDVYLDGSVIYAVFGMNGQLYKVDLLLSGGSATLGIPALVEIDYKPAAQSIQTVRQANGMYRWFAFPAATAVLNRAGELDSRELFENFVKRIDTGEAPYPYLSFYHVGDKIRLGQADYVKVDGYTLLISGTWLNDPLADATRNAIEKTPDYYGISIGYNYAPNSRKKLQVADGIEIPLYTDGILIECSILAERDAACLMTGAYTEGVNRMNKHAKEELDKIVAGDPALEAQVEELVEKVDSVNASTEGLIRREGEEAATTEPETPVVDAVAVEPPVPNLPAELELTEDAMQAITERVSGKVSDGFAAQMELLRSTT
ncbi:MAG: hypothetical protein MUO64_19500, partial [Anaerolineales bacterium]|nr:hypothetical protein [Anaerolineales bacterium]